MFRYMLVELKYKNRSINDLTYKFLYSKIRTMYFMSYAKDQKYMEYYKHMSLLSMVGKGKSTIDMIKSFNHYALPWLEDETETIDKMSREYKDLFGTN